MADGHVKVVEDIVMKNRYEEVFSGRCRIVFQNSYISVKYALHGLMRNLLNILIIAQK